MTSPCASWRKLAQDELTYLANHDVITELPNRSAFLKHLKSVTSEDGGCERGSVLFISLDRHRVINDTLGHDKGEMLLRSIGERIEGLAQAQFADAMIACWGDGEFVVLLPEVDTIAEIDQAATQIQDVIEMPIEIAGHQQNIISWIGASVFPRDGVEPQPLVRRAGMAMHIGRREGIYPCNPFTITLEVQAAERQQLEHDLRNALAGDELKVYFQPKINLDSGRVSGMEALVRWFQPTMGMISPDKFIPIAERTGLIIAIGAWVLRTACAETKVWHDAGYSDLKLAVNLSSRQLEDDDLIDVVKEILDDTGFDPNLLELEVTESSLMGDLDVGLAKLRKLQSMGISIAIDDFGTGYSSLSYLKQLPLNTLKIDQSFVRNVTTDSDDAAIAETIVGMAQNLKLKIVAEGIETTDHADFLRGLGSDIGQGFLYSKALPADEFAQFIEDDAARADQPLTATSVGGD